MLIREILFEDETVDEIKNDLMDIIITFKQKGEKKIPMTGKDGLVELLRNVGFDVTPQNIMQVLTQPAFSSIVKRSSVSDVELKLDVPDTLTSKKEQEKSEEKVAKTAAKASVKAVKSGELT